MHRGRNGYTLFEIMLVLAILIIVGGLAMYSLSGMFKSSNLTAAADAVKSELTRTRNKAQEENRPYRFAVKVNTGSYRIAPDSDEYWGGSGGSGPDNNSAGAGLENTVIEGNLPEKVCFSQPSGVSNGGGASDWSTAAVFSADGSALDDVQLGLSGEGGSGSVVIRLKAPTGIITSASLPVVDKTH